jgi:hypothetical protein
MADRPITFSAPMVQALLAGRKTMTRRVLKPSPGMQSKWLTMEVLHRAPTCYLAEVDGRPGVQMQHPLAGTDGVDPMSPLTWVRLPYAPGDRLWVREAWRILDDLDRISPKEISGGWVHFDATGQDALMGGYPMGSGSEYGRLRSSRFMPRWASRLTLHVSEVRVQRLQEISEEDALAEGCLGHGWVRHPTFGICTDDGQVPTDEFRDLWNSLHGPDAWSENPWVVAISFTVERVNIDQVAA